jgi:hypothetical protein
MDQTTEISNSEIEPVISSTPDPETAPADETPKPTPTEVKRIDFAKRFKPCKLIMFYAHGHRVNDYTVTDREYEVQEDGSEVSKWRTTKVVLDPVNSKRAMSLRSKFISEVCKLGAQYGSEKLVFVDFEREDDLMALKTRWAEEVKAFNLQSPVVKVNFGVLPPLDLTGSNEYLLGNLLDEMQDTMGQMKSALENADYKGVRDVVGRLKGFVSLVPDKQATLIVSAIADARKQARMMTAMLEKKGKTIREVQDMISTSTVDLALGACFTDDGPAVDGPSANDLMEAQAQEFCAALQDGGLDLGNDEVEVPEVFPPVGSNAPVEEDAPVVDPEAEAPDGYTPGDALAAFGGNTGAYWV